MCWRCFRKTSEWTNALVLGTQSWAEFFQVLSLPQLSLEITPSFFVLENGWKLKVAVGANALYMPRVNMCKARANPPITGVSSGGRAEIKMLGAWDAVKLSYNNIRGTLQSQARRSAWFRQSLIAPPAILYYISTAAHCQVRIASSRAPTTSWITVPSSSATEPGTHASQCS